MRNIMSNVCCREFKGWVRSFTKIERSLVILEAILLVTFIVLLVLLILHLLACSEPRVEYLDVRSTTHPTGHPASETTSPTKQRLTQPVLKIKTIANITQQIDIGSFSSNSTSKVCSWTSSAKTAAITHHYEDGVAPHAGATEAYTKMHATGAGSADHLAYPGITSDEDYVAVGDQSFGDTNEAAIPERSEDEDVEQYEPYVMALVKHDPPSDVTYGCILSVVGERWTVTAASCIEAVEEVDSLDSFAVVERLGAGGGAPARAVDDVRIHPLYSGGDRSHDVALVRVTGGPAPAALALASTLDSLLSATGDVFTALGHTPLGSLRGGRVGRLRAALVRRVSAGRCGGGGWALRHLGAGSAGAAGRCGGGGVCAAGACGWCAGTPLLRARSLHAVRAHDPRCGLACGPALYVDVADVADWIRSIVRRD